MSSRSPADAQRLSAVLRLTADAIAITDTTGRILVVNPAAEKLFSIAAGDVARQPVAARTVNAMLGDMLARAIEDQRAHPLVFQLQLDEERDFSASLAPLLSSEGEPEGWLIVLQDVTHFTRLEQVIGEAAQMAAHDLRNPLNLIGGALKLLAEALPEPTPEQQEYLAKMTSGTEQMQTLINDLLSLGSIDAGPGLVKVKLTLGRIAEKAMDDFQLAARDKGVQLAFEGEAATAGVLGEESWLQRAAANLIHNAIKYTPEGGRVRVVYREAGEQGIVEVIDTGPGISPEAQARLFERLYRARTAATRRIPGSGLGLAIVKTIVERHAGQVWVSSEEGQGSTFGFSVPLAREGIDALAEPRSLEHLLALLRDGRARWEALLSEIPEPRWEEPGAEDQWTVKDIVAHMTWYEREAAGVVTTRALMGSEWWELPVHARNARIYEQNKDLDLAAVRAEARQAYEALEKAVQSVTWDLLTDAGQFAHMPPDWAPWQVVSTNSYEHYEQHAPGLRAWLARPPAGARGDQAK